MHMTPSVSTVAKQRPTDREARLPITPARTHALCVGSHGLSLHLSVTRAYLGLLPRLPPHSLRASDAHPGVPLFPLSRRRAGARPAQGIDPVLPLTLERRYPLRPQFPS